MAAHHRPRGRGGGAGPAGRARRYRGRPARAPACRRPGGGGAPAAAVPRRRRVADDAAAEGVGRRDPADDDAVAATRQQRSLEPQLRPAGTEVDDAGGALAGAEVHLGPALGGDLGRALDELDVEPVGGRDRGAGNRDDVAARDLLRAADRRG